MQAIKALIVDDDAHFRERVKKLFSSQADIEVAGEAADGLEAILQARMLGPDIVLMDVRMAGMNGISATREIKTEMPAVKVVVVSLYGLQEYRDAAAGSGADAYVVKKEMVDKLLPVIREVVGRPAEKGASNNGR